MRHTPSILFVTIASAALLIGACATASEESEEDKTPDAGGLFVPPDANSGARPDAASVADASGPADAAIDATPTIPDAGGGIFCDTHSECGSGKCCLLNLCVAGNVVLDVCFPN